MPLLSVLLPVKDSARTLPAAVSSTLRALPKDAEIVILDDGSRDDPQGALGSIVDSRIRLLRMDPSLGVGAGLQYLLDHSDSLYVARMDADDITFPGRFILQTRALQRGADFVFSTIVKFSDGVRTVRPGLPLPISPAAMPLHLLVHNLLCHPTMMARRDAIVAAGGYRRTAAEDYDLWLRALTQGARMARLATPLLAYRHHGKQVSKQAGYTAQATSDPQLRDAYRGFVQGCFEANPTWLNALWGSKPEHADSQQDLAPLRDLIESRSEPLSPGQRLVLSHTAKLLKMRR